MKKIFLVPFLAMLLAFGGLFVQSVSAVTNLVVNGSFEEPVVTDTAQWDIFESGTTGLGWTVEWRSDIPTSDGIYTRPDPALQELHAGVNGWLPQEGSQYAELDTDWYGPGHPQNNEPASVKIYQDLPTGAGCEYNLTFYFSPRPGTPAGDNILEVSWDGTLIDSISRAGNSNTDWTYHAYTLNATGSTTRLEFADGGTANSLGTFLDNVIVEEVSCPEPTKQINIGNIAILSNDVTAVAKTGGNIINDSDKGDNTIWTGDASAYAGVFNTVNSNIVRGCCDSSSKQVNIRNFAMVNNDVTAVAKTGGNEINDGGGDQVFYRWGRTGNNNIWTGNASAFSEVVNQINSNFIFSNILNY
jgi:hypothetical protein